MQIRLNPENLYPPCVWFAFSKQHWFGKNEVWRHTHHPKRKTERVNFSNVSFEWSLGSHIWFSTSYVWCVAGEKWDDMPFVVKIYTRLPISLIFPSDKPPLSLGFYDINSLWWPNGKTAFKCPSLSVSPVLYDETKIRREKKLVG